MTSPYIHKLFPALLSLVMLFVSACAENQVKEEQPGQAKSLDELIYNKARESFLAGKYTVAATLFEPLATKGNANAQYILGYMHYNGLGAEKNLDKAMQLFKKSASQNNLNAMTAMSLIQTSIKKQGNKKVELESNTNSAKPKAVIDLRKLTKAETEQFTLEVKQQADQLAAKKVTPVFEPVKPAPVAPVTPAPASKTALPEPLNDPVTTFPETERPANDNFTPPSQEQSSEWILKQSVNNYTIQLASSSRKRSIMDFIKTIPLDGVYFFTSGTDPVRYHVIHGSFQSFKQATAKLVRLHERGHKNAWIRNMKHVQGLMGGN